jgi:uncharacterized protein
MKRIGYVVAGVLLGAVVAFQLPLLAQDSGSDAPGAPDSRTVTVNGTATIRSAPDEAVISLGVQTQAGNAQDAMRENADRMSAAIAALIDLGIGRDDISTSSVSLYPTYGRDGMDVTGYQASNQVDVTVRDMGNVGRAIDAAVGAGANLTNGITFRLSDENRGVTDALAAAVRDARGKAEALAGAGDAALGRVLTIAETGAPNYPPVLYDRMAVAAEATPIEPPTLETQVSVTVTWELV